MKFFEIFSGKPKEEEKDLVATDGAGHIAIPEGGYNEDLDVRMDGDPEGNTTAEIVRLAQIIENYNKGEDIGNVDINFVTEKLEHLKAEQHKR
jgi:hypothetical protein